MSALYLLNSLSLVSPFLTYREFIVVSSCSKRFSEKISVDKSVLDYWTYVLRKVIFKCELSDHDAHIDMFQLVISRVDKSFPVSTTSLVSLFVNEPSLTELSELYRALQAATNLCVSKTKEEKENEPISRGQEKIRVKAFIHYVPFLVHYNEPTLNLYELFNSPLLIVLYIYTLHLRVRDSEEPIDQRSRDFLRTVITTLYPQSISVQLTFSTWGSLGYFRTRDVRVSKHISLDQLINFICTVHTAKSNTTEGSLSPQIHKAKGTIEEGAPYFLSKISEASRAMEMSGVEAAQLIVV